MIVAFGFPDPFGLVDRFTSLVGGEITDAITGQISDIMAWLVEAVLSALVDVTTAVLEFFWDASDPQVGADWFSGGDASPYGQMVVLAAPLLMACLLLGIIQGVIQGDPAGMVRMAFLRLPGAVLAMTITIVTVDLLLQATNEMSDAVLGPFQDDVAQTVEMIGVARLTPELAGGGMLLALVFGFVGLAAAVVVVLELFVRAGLIYLVVAFAPMIYAASVWPALKGLVAKMVKICVALIASKLVIAMALGFSAAAMNSLWNDGSGSGSLGSVEGGELVTPEQIASQEGAAAVIGTLMAAIVMFAVAGFMPFVLYRLMPVFEDAGVAQGIKSAPMRGTQQAYYMGQVASHNPASAAMRSHRGRPSSAGGRPGGSHSAGRNGPGGHGAKPGGAGGPGSGGGGSAAAGTAGTGTAAATGASGSAAAAAGPAGAAAAAGVNAAKSGMQRGKARVEASVSSQVDAGSGGGGAARSSQRSLPAPPPRGSRRRGDGRS